MTRAHLLQKYYQVVQTFRDSCRLGNWLCSRLSIVISSLYYASIYLSSFSKIQFEWNPRRESLTGGADYENYYHSYQDRIFIKRLDKLRLLVMLVYLVIYCAAGYGFYRSQNECEYMNIEMIVTGPYNSSSLLFGNNPYQMYGTDWNLAAVHAGLISPGQSRVVVIQTDKLLESFPGSERNAVKSTALNDGYS
jgi:hypothetical protein